MSILTHEHVPITVSRSPSRRRRSDIAIPISLLTVAVILGIGITAFSNVPRMDGDAPSTVGYATRDR
jgi:hypothetical protein